jgi:hypothetical protein
VVAPKKKHTVTPTKKLVVLIVWTQINGLSIETHDDLGIPHFKKPPFVYVYIYVYIYTHEREREIDQFKDLGVPPVFKPSF